MSKYNKKKSDTLGMDFDKAFHKLRRSMMYHLMKQCGLSKCYRCGDEIGNPEDVSMDHKIDWLKSELATELFFDVLNVAFSHKRCNTIASNKNRPLKSGVVRRSKGKNRYIARIWYGSKTVYLGCFPRRKEAEDAVVEAKNGLVAER